MRCYHFHGAKLFHHPLVWGSVRLESAMGSVITARSWTSGETLWSPSVSAMIRWWWLGFSATVSLKPVVLLFKSFVKNYNDGKKNFTQATIWTSNVHDFCTSYEKYALLMIQTHNPHITRSLHTTALHNHMLWLDIIYLYYFSKLYIKFLDAN